MSITNYVSLAAFLVWLAYVTVTEQDADTLEVSLRPWVKRLLRLPAHACEYCHDTGLTTIRGFCGGVEMDCDDQPCQFCEEERTSAQPGEKH